MRIHKTASESLARQILDRLPPRSVCPGQFDWEVRGLALPALRQFSFFQGHISPATLSAIFTPLQVFTMVREPKERLLSCYYYWKEGSKHARSQFFDAIAPLSLTEFLHSDEPVIRRVTWNTQARLLAGGQFGGSDDLRQNVFGPWLSERALAAEAVRAMDRFALVGVADRYEQSLRSAYELLDLGEPPPLERVNVTVGKPTSYHALLAAPEIDNALSRLTQADQAVYAAACRRLDRDSSNTNSGPLWRHARSSAPMAPHDRAGVEAL